MISPLLLMTTLLAGQPPFVRHDIADYPGAYQVTVADLNADGGGVSQMKAERPLGRTA